MGWEVEREFSAIELNVHLHKKSEHNQIDKVTITRNVKPFSHGTNRNIRCNIIREPKYTSANTAERNRFDTRLYSKVQATYVALSECRFVFCSRSNCAYNIPCWKVESWREFCFAFSASTKCGIEFQELRTSGSMYASIDYKNLNN